MSEELSVKKSIDINTKESIIRNLKALGVEPGMTLLVHSSLSSIGWVCGGAITVVEALMEVITRDGTLIMPTHSADLSEPSKWGNPPVPEEWWPIIRETMPAFNPQITPTRKMGKIVEVFRTYPDVLRSYHPAVSFAAWGKYAETITSNHSLEFGLGEGSPLARIYELDGHVLLIGVTHENNTSLHLSEHRITNRTITEEGAPIWENGNRVWKVYRDIRMDSDRFEEIGAEFECKYPVQIGKIGVAESRLFRQKTCVDFGQQWLNAGQAN